jgi:hypothetical protein
MHGPAFAGDAAAALRALATHFDSALEAALGERGVPPDALGSVGPSGNVYPESPSR